MLNTPLFGVGVIDTAAVWKWVRQEIADPNSLLSASLAQNDEADAVKDLLQVILEAELSVPLVKIWSSELEKSFLECSVVDVSQGKRLLPRLLEAARMFAPSQGYDEDE